jgi:hypothetical protein
MGMSASTSTGSESNREDDAQGHKQKYAAGATAATIAAATTK